MNTNERHNIIPKNPFVRIKSMVKLDFYRLFHTPIFYVMLFISAFVPAMVLSMVNGENGASFNNVWQVVELISGGTQGQSIMSLATMCNINMVFIFAALVVTIFVSHDYSSGFAKNIFTVHSKKQDYIISKALVGVFSGVCMIIAYTLAAVILGAIMGKSFDLGNANVGNLIACLVSKMGLMMLFVPVYLAISVFCKQRLWLSIILAFIVGILFYPVSMISSPLNSGILSVVLCVLGGAAFGVGGGALGTLLLYKRDLV